MAASRPMPTGVCAPLTRAMTWSSLNSDVIPRRRWLACLQYAASRGPDVGVVGAKLLYPDDRIQYAGTVGNLGPSNGSTIAIDSNPPTGARLTSPAQR